MCEWSEWGDTRIDPCLRNLIFMLEELGIKTLACCCGHGKYNLSIVIKDTDGKPLEIVTNKTIPRKVRFYKRDKDGYYFIPETVMDKRV